MQHKNYIHMLLHHCTVHSVNNVVNILIIKGNLYWLFDIFLVFFKNKIFGQVKFNRQLKLVLCTCHSM